MSGPQSRRNSMTSLATANTTTSSQNNISGHDLSTDNLIAVDSKFVKKPTKKFPNSNGISQSLSTIQLYAVVLVIITAQEAHSMQKKVSTIFQMVKCFDQEQPCQEKQAK